MFDSVRPIDNLGRACIPKEIREHLELEKGSLVRIFYVDRGIRIEPYKGACFFCGTSENLREINGKILCLSCKRRLKKDLLEEDDDSLL
ncbi:MAG: AbrB/MazE/SpoVT family DNA-binding domain-containing protein [Clostridiales bacterium]|nr:AbrB/MazE/SpoVT family DNA-binding domain-containing protein [Clostridiales bacterium]